MREVEKDRLREKLIEAREQVLNQKDSFCMCGVEFLCSDSVVDKLCDQAKYIEDINDFPTELFGVRREIKLTFFSIICNNCPLISHDSMFRRRLLL